MAKQKTINKKVDNVEVILQVNGKEYSAGGLDIKDALAQLRPGKLTTKGALIVRQDGKQAKILLNIIQMRRLFGEYSSSMKEVMMVLITKRASLLFK